jgi:xanthine dehydrogenase iron-sulfur cluster and FAD-binding subunit A
VRREAETVGIAFTLNGRPLHVRVRSSARLLDLLRDDLRLTGAKEGCGTGECGACTVIVNGKSVASCLMMGYQADGCQVETVEGLSEDGHIHPLQEAFVERGAVQCGFCTSGMILAAKAALDMGPPASAEAVREALSGNLCRCTGYGKIVQAVSRAALVHPPPAPSPVTPAAAPSYFCPHTLEEALEILAQREGEVRPLAGGTDLLLQVRSGRLDPGALFDISNVPELQGIEDQGERIMVGAGSTLDAIARSNLIATWAPPLREAAALVGSPQIRNRATLGGNLATASPLSDMIPALLSLDAIVHAVSVSARREVPVLDFLQASGATGLARDELILGVEIAKRRGIRGAYLRLSERRAFSRVKVSVAASMTFKDGRPEWVRVALGGSRIGRAQRAEKALMAGSHQGFRDALQAIQEESFAATDLLSSEAYRRAMAAVLLERAVRRLAEA